MAISTVLAAFLGGLSLGGWWAGRRAERSSRPLTTYAKLEFAVALGALAVPFAIRAAEPLYRAAYPALVNSFWALTAVRFVVSSALLLLPTFLMGATLPYLVRAASRSGSGASVASLYAVNTFGAAAGVLASSFVLLPRFGLRATLFGGVALTFVVAVAALALGRREVEAGDSRDEPTSGGAKGYRREAMPGREEAARGLGLSNSGIAWIAAALGFSALASEVLWTRTLTLALGTTTHAFAIVLATILFGIAAGSLAASRLLGRRAAPSVGSTPPPLHPASTEAKDSARHAAPDRSPVPNDAPQLLARRVIPLAPALVGLASLAVLPLFDRLPDLYVTLSAQGPGTFAASLAVKFLLAALPLLLPTFLSGFAFPLAVAATTHTPSEGAGRIYAANTWGSICGSIAASAALAAGFGLQRGLLAAALLLVITSLLASRGRARLAAAAFTILALLAAVIMPDWNRSALTRGGFAVGVELRRSGRTSLGRDLSEIVFLEEGLTSTISVRRSGDELTMQMNGVTEASNTGDLATQILLGFIPTALHPAPRDALVIGLGSGITAAAVARFPTITQIDCVEISEAVVHGASFFDAANEGVLHDPRMHLRLGDGRNHLALSGKKYDVIVSEPSNVWNSGIGDLMTAEFFGLARSALRPGGILCSWIQGYAISPEILRSLLAAAGTHFPNVTLWMGSWGDFMIVAGDESLTFDAEHLRAHGAHPKLLELLDRADVADLSSFLSLNLLAGSSTNTFVGAATANTDDNMLLELVAPKLLHEDTMPGLFEALHRVAGGTETLLRNAPPDLGAALPQLRQARALESRARLAIREGRGPEGIDFFETAWRLHPTARSIAEGLASAYVSRGRALARNQDFPGATSSYLRAAEVDPRTATPFAELARLYVSAGDLETAGRALEEARHRDPDDADALAVQAEFLLLSGDFSAAGEAARRTLARLPDHPEATITLARAFDRLGETSRADSVLAEALRRHPDSPELVAARRKLRTRVAPAAPGAAPSNSTTEADSSMSRSGIKGDR